MADQSRDQGTDTSGHHTVNLPTYDPATNRFYASGEVATSTGVDPMAGHADQGTYYNPVTGAYGEHYDYPTAAGVHHHRERTGATGVYRERDVDIRDDGSKHVHRVYDNPNTGTRVERDYEVDEFGS